MKPLTSPTRTPLLSRRAALGAGVGVAGAVALGGCALREEKTPAARAVRDLAPDVAVAVQAVVLLRGAESAVITTSSRHPQLAVRLDDVLALHRAHLDAVLAAVPDGVDTSATGAAHVVPARPARALAALGVAERSLHDGLIGLAMRAESGPFARLLGAMAAAVSQRLPGLAP
jgi:hypothetical protein